MRTAALVLASILAVSAAAYAQSTQNTEFIVERVSQNVLGGPMLVISPPPLNRDGVPDFSEALEKVLAPHLKGRDNISLRFIDQGLPTTVTAVSASTDVEY